MLLFILQSLPLWKVLIYLLPTDLNIFFFPNNIINIDQLINCLIFIIEIITSDLVSLTEKLFSTYDNPENMPPVDEEAEALKNQPPVVQRVEWLWFGIFFYICIAVIIDQIFPWSNFDDKKDPGNNPPKN